MSIDISLDKQKHIFGRLFLLSNKLQVAGDHALDKGITIQQWLLAVAIARFGNDYPTLSEAAELIGSTRQNVKQLAVKLMKNDLISFKKDERDQRAIRLMITDKSSILYLSQQKRFRQFLFELFKDLSDDEIEFLYNSLNKLYEGNRNAKHKC